ncbi:unnamed protein product [Hymenolepis diminuta]|uniref:Radial spoke head protein 3 homolog n=1 Tax=Hymenolepis diminuta TaxID=6216 RepID=A0A0R3SQ30_HYMDI|nr:unnamed protein product [Hymenolepis diminuta]
MIDRPPSPLFVPAKTGMDASTEILPGDLFDFDLEVKPILEVLVGKTMEQALLEVCEEEELARIREQQLRYEEIRAADLMEMQRLEERERRYREEKERRIAQHKVYEAKRKETIEKIAARAFARVYIEPLIPNVYEQLHMNGYFKIEEDFIPGLLDDVSEELNRERAYRLVVDSIIREAVTEITEAYAKHDAKDSEELRKLNPPNEENAIEKSENHEVNQPIQESNDKNATSNNDEIHNQEG